MFMKRRNPMLLRNVIRTLLQMSDTDCRDYLEAWRDLFYRRQGVKFHRESRPAAEDPPDPP